MQATSYSTTVRGWMIIGDQRLELAQLGPDFCIVRSPIDHPPTEAEIFVSVDGAVRRRSAFLPHGISRHSAEIALRLNGAATLWSRNEQSVP